MVSVAWIVGAASIVDFGIQLVGWAISSAMKTEKYYDLCGSGAFAAVAVSTFACTNGEPRAALATTALLAWAMRLGAFLVTRVHKDGGDKRFDGIKEDPATFGIYWFIQGIWVLVTAMPVILINAERGDARTVESFRLDRVCHFCRRIDHGNGRRSTKKSVQSGREE